jgi:hypothetical protein
VQPRARLLRRRALESSPRPSGDDPAPLQRAFAGNKKLAKDIAAAYFETAKSMAARSRRAVVVEPVIGRYASAAARWSQSAEPRRWYFAQASEALALVDSPGRRARPTLDGRRGAAEPPRPTG